MSRILFVDIKTMPPAGEAAEAARKEIMIRFPDQGAVKQRAVPISFRDPLKIAEREAHNRAAAEAALLEKNGEQSRRRALEYRKLAYDGSTGEIASISWTLGADRFVCVATQNGAQFGERVVLEAFLTAMSDQKAGLQLVAAYNAFFVLRFIWQRLIVHSLPVPVWWPLQAVVMRDRIFDAMAMWAGNGQQVTLVSACKALAIPVTPWTAGYETYDFYAEGRLGELSVHNQADVRRVRSVARRIAGLQPLRADLQALGVERPRAPKPVVVCDLPAELPDEVA